MSCCGEAQLRKNKAGAIVHSAKNGLFTVTDNRGRILGQIRSNTMSFASLIADVPLDHGQTIFNRYGA